MGGGLFDVMYEPQITEPATFDENENESTPDIYQVFDFGINEVFPVTTDNYFAGWEPPAIIE